MKAICAWCGKFLGVKESSFQDDKRTTHGICPECKVKLLKDLSDFKEGRHGNDARGNQGSGVSHA